MRRRSIVDWLTLRDFPDELSVSGRCWNIGFSSHGILELPISKGLLDRCFCYTCDGLFSFFRSINKVTTQDRFLSNGQYSIRILVSVGGTKCSPRTRYIFICRVIVPVDKNIPSDEIALVSRDFAFGWKEAWVLRTLVKVVEISHGLHVWSHVFPC